jgi:hypothetical protein
MKRKILVLGIGFVFVLVLIGVSVSFCYFYYLHPSHTWRLPLGQDEAKRQLAYKDAILPSLGIGAFFGLFGFWVVTVLLVRKRFSSSRLTEEAFYQHLTLSSL